MILLIASIFIFVTGLVTFLFRRRFVANLPSLESPRSKDLHSGAPAKAAAMSIVVMVVGHVGIIIFVARFR